MSALEHSPGPLEVKESNAGTRIYIEISEVGELPFIRLEPYADDVSGIREARAKARLFAAAPELLDCLKALLSKGPTAENIEASMDAIAKAEGK